MGLDETRKLAELLAMITSLQAPADVKIGLLETGATLIAEGSQGTWEFTKVVAIDGARGITGRMSEIVVITAVGDVYRGKMSSWRVTGEGIALDYSKLVKL